MRNIIPKGISMKRRKQWDRLGLGLCTVASTLEDINKVFDNTPPIDG